MNSDYFDLNVLIIPFVARIWTLPYEESAFGWRLSFDPCVVNFGT